MFQVARWKVILVIVSTVLAIAFALPNVLPQQTLSALPGWMTQRLNLGLDLRGGAYLLLEADTKSLKDDHMTNLMDDIRNVLANEQITYTGPTRTGDEIVIELADPAQLDTAFREISNAAQPSQGAPAEFVVSRDGDRRIVATFQPAAMATLTSDALSQALEIVRRRIDPEGNKEIAIAKQGVDRIVVQAPGDNDPERLKNLIGQTAKMTFQMVDETVSMEEAAAGFAPPDTEVLPMDSGGVIVVKRRAIVNGDMLTKAAPTTDELGRPAVQLRFNRQGARRFGDTTAQNIGQRFAIILDGKVISAPVIQGAIPGGVGQITGIGTIADATDLSNLLNAGKLPIPLTVLAQRAVTAELGADAVAAGQTATLIAFIAVLVFMVLAYGFLFGGISVAALVINGAMLIAMMSLFQATLTLPGIAGLILTLAMAVDANVLIYERMRDEARAGNNVINSMGAGFGKAMVTILDANLTTLIAAAMMFLFGEGPVKGFAWTLTIGLFTSVFTAVYVTQVLLAFWFRVARPKTLPIAS